LFHHPEQKKESQGGNRWNRDQGVHSLYELMGGHKLGKAIQRIGRGGEKNNTLEKGNHRTGVKRLGEKEVWGPAK